MPKLDTALRNPATGTANGMQAVAGGARHDASPAGSPFDQDKETLGRLLFALEPRLVAVALRMTRNLDAARDVVQSAFEKALRKGRDQFRGDALLSTWMHRIVVNESLMWLRSERRRNDRIQSSPDLDEVPALTREPAPDARLGHEQEADRLRDALGELRAEQRELLVHCAMGDESYLDFGRRHGLHPNAVKSRAFRARKGLRAILER